MDSSQQQMAISWSTMEERLAARQASLTGLPAATCLRASTKSWDHPGLHKDRLVVAGMCIRVHGLCDACHKYLAGQTGPGSVPNG